LIALGQIGTEQQHWTTAFLASTSFSIADGAKATRDMSMSSVPIGKIAGSVQMYSGNAVEAVLFSYHVPSKQGGIDIDQCSTTGKFNCDLPDLSGLGGDYCFSIQDAFGDVSATRCGGQIGMTDFSMQVPAPPQFKSLVTGTPISKTEKLSWTGLSHAVYMLDVGPDFAGRNTPHVQAYTSDTQLGWPDLSSLGVSFPSGSTYNCRVSALVPYSSIDDFASSRGRTATGADRQQLDSQTSKLPLVN
jgi:hypothetical protein